jgi:hypothetical protein
MLLNGYLLLGPHKDKLLTHNLKLLRNYSGNVEAYNEIKMSLNRVSSSGGGVGGSFPPEGKRERRGKGEREKERERDGGRKGSIYMRTYIFFGAVTSDL